MCSVCGCVRGICTWRPLILHPFTCTAFENVSSISANSVGGSVGGVVMPTGSKVVLESPGSSEQNEEEESPDMDVDYVEDYDSDEEKRSHRKRKRVIHLCTAYNTYLHTVIFRSYSEMLIDAQVQQLQLCIL